MRVKNRFCRVSGQLSQFFRSGMPLLKLDGPVLPAHKMGRRTTLYRRLSHYQNIPLLVVVFFIFYMTCRMQKPLKKINATEPIRAHPHAWNDVAERKSRRPPLRITFQSARMRKIHLTFLRIQIVACRLRQLLQSNGSGDGKTALLVQFQYDRLAFWHAGIIN